MFAKGLLYRKLWLGRKARARDAFHRAYERYQSALSRGDTRAQHDAFPALRRAMEAKLRVGA